MTDVREDADALSGAPSRRSSTLVTAGILVSRVAGFVRQRAMSHFFAASYLKDAFDAAFKIPNLMQNLLGEGVLSASFIPVYSRLLAEGREEEAGRVAGAIAGLLALAAAVVTVVGVVFADPILTVIAPGLPTETHVLAVTTMRIVTPGVGLLVLSAWCLGVLNSHRRFFLSYVAPVLWSIAQIAVLVTAGALLLPSMGRPDLAASETLERLVVALAWGSLLGALLQFLVQLPSVLKLLRGFRLSVETSRPGTRQVLRAFGPVVAGRGVVQLLTFVDLMLASLLVSGAIAMLGYAQTLFVLPVSLFGMSVAAAELPELSSADLDDKHAIADRLGHGLARIAFLVVPSALVFFLLGDLVVGALYRSGAFDRQDEVVVWLVLAGFSIGLLANTSSRLLQSAMYGAGDAKTPAKIAAVRVVVAASVGAVLMLQLDRIAYDGAAFLLVGDLPAFEPIRPALRDDPALLHLGAVGLSSAAGASAWIEYQLLRRTLSRRLDRDIRAGGGDLPRILLAAVAAGIVAIGARYIVSGWHPIPGAAVALPLTGAAYLAAATALGVGEARALVGLVRRRLGR
ncbi:MAG: murein biosynthesis integral membrane protein MurJ [Actinobacteria bacterium]|nr:murein biosynthesis integral membrane protein MurJ [Actinomycetota bacterium]